MAFASPAHRCSAVALSNIQCINDKQFDGGGLIKIRQDDHGRRQTKDNPSIMSSSIRIQ